jgi:peptide/nickel transport system permease protein
VGIPIGIMSARHPGGLRDRIGQSFILIGLSFPTFVLGMTSLYVFYFLPRQAGFTFLPGGGYKPLLSGPADWAWHMILPWTTLALTNAAVYARSPAARCSKCWGRLCPHGSRQGAERARRGMESTACAPR